MKNNNVTLLIICMMAVVIGIACTTKSKSDESNTKTEAVETTAAEGWISLFDGETTKGWHKYGGDPVGAAWKVDNGVLYLDTTNRVDWQIKDGGDIVSDLEFENFHLKLQWRISKNGNSGIMFYVHEDEQYNWPWQTGPEMQVLDNDGHPDGKIEKHNAADLYDLIRSGAQPRPVGEWNDAEIKCVDGKLEFIFNGEVVVSTTLWDDNWKAMVAASKFGEMPGFGTYKKGRIAIQDHGDMVWYRNIMVKRL